MDTALEIHPEVQIVILSHSRYAAETHDLHRLLPGHSTIARGADRSTLAFEALIGADPAPKVAVAGAGVATLSVADLTKGASPNLAVDWR